MIVTIIVVIVCIALEGFFSGSEIAFVNANRLGLRAKADTGSLGAKIAIKFLDNPEKLLSTTLVGTNLSAVTATTTAAFYLLSIYPDSGEYYSIVLVWPLILLLGEIVPKSVYQANADRITPIAALLLQFFYFALFPFVFVFSNFSTLLVTLLKERGAPEPSITRGDVKAITRDGVIGGDIHLDEQRMIGRTIDFTRSKVSEIAVPLIDVVEIPFSMSAGDAATFAMEKAYSRFPVYKNRVDNIVGIVDTFSLLNLEDPSDSIRKYMRKPVFVPETMSAKTLLEELRHRGISMAIVVDEWGGAVGIATIEDVLEEIMGDIEDEFDAFEPSYRKVGKNSYIFSARTEIDTINERFDFSLPDGDYETLGGFLLDRFDRIPKNGEQFELGNLRFTIIDPTDRSLKQVRLDILPTSA